MVFYKVKHVCTIPSIIPLLGIYTRERKIYVHRKTRTQLFRVVGKGINDSVMLMQ